MTLDELFDRHRDTLQCCIECGEGWWPIIDKMCDEMKELDIGVKFVQIKEKFGELRAYYEHDNVSDSSSALKLLCRLNDVTDRAERASLKTCERCGKPGKLRHHSWLKTLCDECNGPVD